MQICAVRTAKLDLTVELLTTGYPPAELAVSWQAVHVRPVCNAGTQHKFPACMPALHVVYCAARMGAVDDRVLNRQSSLWDKVQEQFPVDLDLNARGADGATPQKPGPESEDLRDVASSPDVQTVWCHSCGMQLRCRFSNR